MVAVKSEYVVAKNGRQYSRVSPLERARVMISNRNGSVLIGLAHTNPWNIGAREESARHEV